MEVFACANMFSLGFWEPQFPISEHMLRDLNAKGVVKKVPFISLVNKFVPNSFH